LAAELVRGKVDVIGTSRDQAIAAVKQQTRTIPIVMANSTDPATTGFVASLARPGKHHWAQRHVPGAQRHAFARSFPQCPE
jgi:ABC-type uncharacterized transport system substrate-binding protein